VNRKTLIITLVIVGVLCLCCGGVGIVLATQAGRLVSQTVSLDPVKSEQVAQAITDYTLPPNYKPAFSMSLLGISMASFASGDDSTFIILYQLPATSGLSQEQMEEQMRKAFSQQMNQNYQLEKTGTLPVTIRGKQTELGVYEGTNSDSVRVRQLIGVFEGKNGTAFLMITGNIDSWDQASINKFISSMR
jgi:hypothetical protein